MKKILLLVLLITISFTTKNKDLNDLPLYDKLSFSDDEIEQEEIKFEENPVDQSEIIVREFHQLHPAFRNKIIQLTIEAKKQGIDIFISETYRTPERQNKLLKKGYSKLKGGRSKHQFGLAVDIIPVIDGISQHKNDVVLKKVGIIGEKLGLRWGGRWKKLYDPVHFEWNCRIRDLENGWLPEIPDTTIIPSENFFYVPKKKK